MSHQPPEFPAGPYVALGENMSREKRENKIAELRAFPTSLRRETETLSEPQLDTKYRNWTIRQIVHHLADSHVNSYVRFKWTLTENRPTIKAYDESRWSDLSESRDGGITVSLLLLDGIHARWCQLLESMTDKQFDRSYVHPETNSIVTLQDALNSYVWHGDHHLGQIRWLIKSWTIQNDFG